jgi:hypothetical protein
MPLELGEVRFENLTAAWTEENIFLNLTDSYLSTMCGA